VTYDDGIKKWVDLRKRSFTIEGEEAFFWTPDILEHIQSDEAASRLIAASWLGDLEAMAKILEEEGDELDLNQGDYENNQTPIHFAAKQGNLKAIEMLVEHGADIEREDRNGWTALTLAGFREQVETVEALVNGYGVDIDRKNKNDLSPIELALEKNEFQIALLFAKLGASVESVVDEEGNTLLLKALKQKDLGRMEELGKLGADPTHQGRTGKSPLWTAFEMKFYEGMQKLVQMGADRYEQDEEGYTPIHMVVKEGNEDGLKQLVRIGYDVQTDEGHGVVPLIVAMFNRKYKLARQLIQEYGVDVDRRLKFGFSPLHILAKVGDDIGIKMLLDAGADIDNVDSEGRTPYSVAVGHEQEIVMAMLEEMGANVEIGMVM
jgi:ankyrin